MEIVSISSSLAHGVLRPQRERYRRQVVMPFRLDTDVLRSRLALGGYTSKSTSCRDVQHPVGSATMEMRRREPVSAGTSKRDASRARAWKLEFWLDTVL